MTCLALAHLRLQLHELPQYTGLQTAGQLRCVPQAPRNGPSGSWDTVAESPPVRRPSDRSQRAEQVCITGELILRASGIIPVKQRGTLCASKQGSLASSSVLLAVIRPVVAERGQTALRRELG